MPAGFLVKRAYLSYDNYNKKGNKNRIGWILKSFLQASRSNWTGN